MRRCAGISFSIGHSSKACDELAGEAAESSQVDGIDVGEQLVVGAVQQRNEHGGYVDIGVVTACPVGQAIEQPGELRDHVLRQVGEPTPQLRTAQRRDADLGEQHAAVAVRRQLEEQEVEGTLERALRVENVELGLQRPARVVDDLVDGGDEQGSFDAK